MTKIKQGLWYQCKKSHPYFTEGNYYYAPSDDRWEVWMSLPNRQVPVTMDAFRERRMAYELEMEKQHYKSLFKRI